MFKPSLSERILIPTKRTVGILGTAQSGKTVLLTSLLNHLMQHRDDFRAKTPKGNQVDIIYVRRDTEGYQEQDWYNDAETEADTGAPEKVVPITHCEGNSENTIPRFPYELYREALAKRNEWPEKTTALSRFDCRVKYMRPGSSYPEPGYRDISFFDMPGERLSDLEMTAYPRYEDWADKILYGFTLSADMKSRLTHVYGDTLRQQSITASNVTRAYKLMVAEFFLDGHPNITPSTLIMDQRGKHPPNQGMSPADMTDNFFCGLSQESEFAPLPRQFREKHPEIATEFSKHYTTYRNTIAEPFRILLNKCDSMILLVDVLDILECGPKALNSTGVFLQEVLRLFTPEGRIARLGRLLTGKNNLKRLAIAAPKMDVVAISDRQENKPTNLLREMMHNIVAYNNLPFQPAYIPFYAAQAGNQRFDDLKKCWFIDGKSKEDMEVGSYEAAILPKTWEKTWNPDSYHFPKLLPNAPENWIYAPDQWHLDDLYNYVVEGTPYVDKS